MFDISSAVWNRITSSFLIPEEVLFWINDNTSLTQKLRNKYSRFEVKIIRQESSRLYTHELDFFDRNENFVVREVLLIGNKKPVVFARSVIPISKDTDKIIEVGNKPLGEILFNDPLIIRKEIEVTNINGTWGRRSIFNINQTKLLVSEFFLENIYA